MPYARIDDGIDLYYELTGPEDGPVVIQFGGGLFGRHNFGFVNDGFRERGFRLLSFDARGYGASTSPREWYTIEGWADDGAKLLDALGLDRVLVHGTSMGGMIAIAFTATHGRRVIGDVRRRRVREARRLPGDPLPGLAPDGRVDAVGRLLRPRHDAGGRRRLPRERGGQGHLRDCAHGDRRQRPVHRPAGVPGDGADGPLALVPTIERPMLMTNGTHDILCPPVLAPSGLGARRMAELNPAITTHEFPDIGHADLLECPDEAVRIVSSFFEAALSDDA